MSYELKPNCGFIFKNDKKEKDSHPDYRGKLKIGGKEFELSLWVRDGKKGKYFSVTAKEKTPF